MQLTPPTCTSNSIKMNDFSLARVQLRIVPKHVYTSFQKSTITESHDKRTWAQAEQIMQWNFKTFPNRTFVKYAVQINTHDHQSNQKVLLVRFVTVYWEQTEHIIFNFLHGPRSCWQNRADSCHAEPNLVLQNHAPLWWDKKTSAHFRNKYIHSYPFISITQTIVYTSVRRL